ncbi:serine hydrolase [Stappia sp. MMSF_3263]|uniref:serine hydrolase domain-containing protein n=1 Tax=Stappia sp. MMSF_3263 TaxID=3046693 RepID=UPI00273FF389|nr:serine hydrolase domain-containing protein [Stappia sp. MMSF_3263]
MTPAQIALAVLAALGMLALAVASLFIFLELSAVHLPRLAAPAGLTEPEKAAALDAWLDELERREKFNGTILVARDGRTVLQRNIGAADTDGRPIGDRTSFNLASVSKQMTAFAILLLEHEGKLSTGDLLTRHIPELHRHGKVTINHLLEHTSGLPDYALDKALARRLEATAMLLTPDGLIDWLAAYPRAPDFAPGEREDYVNSNYVLLAEIVARVSGLSFADFMRTRVFTPLGMRHSAVIDRREKEALLSDRAFGFRKRFLHAGRPVRFDLTPLDGLAGDGNIYASAGDLVIWDQALRQGTLLPAETYARAYRPVRLSNGEIVREKVLGETLQPGLGWNVQDMPVVTAYGRWQAFSNFYRRDLVQGTVLVVLSNSGFFLRTAMIGERLAAFLSR